MLRSIEKYGLKAFIVNETYDIAYTKEELDAKEKYWISFYNSSNPDFGYNYTDGGDSISNNLKIPVVQLKINGEFIKEWESISHAEFSLNINHIWKACKGGIKTAGGFRWMYLKDYDEEKIEPIFLRKRVVQISLQGDFIKLWNNLSEISQQFNVSESSVALCCNKRTNSIKSFVWRYEDEYDKAEDIDIMPTDRAVIQLTLKGELVREYSSITNASIYIGKPKGVTNIQACCRGNKKSAYGYIWLYKEDYCIKTDYMYEAKGNCTPRKIVQLDLKGEYIKVWNMIKDAEIKLGVYHGGITMCCRGQRKSAHNYKWMYYKDYIKQQENLKAV